MIYFCNMNKSFKQQVNMFIMNVLAFYDVIKERYCALNIVPNCSSYHLLRNQIFRIITSSACKKLLLIVKKGIIIKFPYRLPGNDNCFATNIFYL